VILEYVAEKQQLVLTSESEGLGKNVVELESGIEGPGGAVVMNHHYILEGLTCGETEDVIIKIVNDSSPSLITSKGDETYLYLVMPIKI
jgi:DNA polymerase III sliding clamp (beta) subunit (PCNA family)